MGFTSGDFFRSRFFRAKDVKQPITLTLRDVTRDAFGEEKRIKPVLWFEEDTRGFVVNVTNWRTLSRAYGDDTDLWLTQPLTLLVEQVSFQGRVLDSIRVQHSHAPTNGSA